MTVHGKQSTDCLKTYVRLVASVYGSDKVLKVLSYSLKLIGHLPRVSAGNAQLATALNSIGDDVSNARAVTRLHGTAESIEAFMNDSWAGDWHDSRIKKLAKLQALSMVAYYPLELQCWLRCIAPRYFTGDWETPSNRSCWAWGVYLVLNLCMAVFKLRELHKKATHAVAHLGEASTEEDKLEAHSHVVAIDKHKKAVLWDAVRDCLFLPNCVHWSVRGGVFNPLVVNGLGLAEGAVGLWRMAISM